MLESIQPYIPHIGIIIAIGLILRAAHKNADSEFNIFDYFIDPISKKASITKSLQLLAGLTSTWVVVKLTVAGTLSTEMFFAYMAAMGISEGWNKLVSLKYRNEPKE